MTTTGPVVVVGTGTAGMATVEGPRRNGFDGHISWIGAESVLSGHDEILVIDGAIDDREFLALNRKGTRLVGALGVNRVRALRHWRSQIAAGARWNEIDKAAA